MEPLLCLRREGSPAAVIQGHPVGVVVVPRRELAAIPVPPVPRLWLSRRTCTPGRGSAPCVHRRRPQRRHLLLALRHLRRCHPCRRIHTELGVSRLQAAAASPLAIRLRSSVQCALTVSKLTASRRGSLKWTSSCSFPRRRALRVPHHLTTWPTRQPRPTGQSRPSSSPPEALQSIRRATATPATWCTHEVPPHSNFR